MTVEGNSPNPRLRALSRFRVSRGLGTMLVAVAVLFIASVLIAPSSVTPGSLLSMLPFAAVLAIAGLGQMLVVQQGGFDLSVPGGISFAVVLVTHIPRGDDALLFPAILIALAVAVVAGLFNGFLVGQLGLNAIIATLGTNALFFGAILGVSGGTPTGTTGFLASTIGGSTLGLPNALLVAVLVLLVVIVLTKTTVFGRRFEAVGSSAPTSTALGFRVRAYKGSAYVGAQLLYTIAGIVIAGITLQPSAYLGNNYLLPSVAVVVLAGTSLLGGRGFPLSTAIAALFLTQLDQFTLALGAPYAAQTLVQAVALAVGVALYAVDWSSIKRSLSQRRAASAAPSA